VDSITRWQQVLEHNPADLSRNELWSVCVSVAMSFQIKGRTYEEFWSWYQWEWAATEKLGRQNNHRPGKGGGLNKLRVGEPEERVLYYQLDRAWETAERNIANTELPSTADLRFVVESNTSRTGSTLLRTTHTQLQQLMEKHRNIEKMIARFTSFSLMGVLERHVELLTFSAEEKFRTLLKRSPHVLQLIPHKYLASYIGMDATTFSKLMATIRIA